MYLCRRLTNASFPIIGESFNRNHTTVISDIAVIERRLVDPTSGPVFARLIEQLSRQIVISDNVRCAA
jgi:chromosomal replication initiation ATPase DnaA